MPGKHKYNSKNAHASNVLPIATTIASKFMKGKKRSSKTNVYKKYEILNEKIITIIVIIVRNSDFVYSHMHININKPPDTMSHVSRIRYSSNKALFIPSSIATTDMFSCSKSNFSNS